MPALAPPAVLQHHLAGAASLLQRGPWTCWQHLASLAVTQQLPALRGAGLLGSAQPRHEQAATQRQQRAQHHTTQHDRRCHHHQHQQQQLAHDHHRRQAPHAACPLAHPAACAAGGPAQRHAWRLASISISSTSTSSNVAARRRGYASRAAAMAAASPASILEDLRRLRDADEAQVGLTPAAVVDRLDRVIIGQDDAKRAVAIAFRNRWRRQRVADPDMAREITPKNLLLIGPTGCGKTEIARRLAKLAEAPFVKVEATKFTEVGYHGRDVDQIVRDLAEAALALVKARCKRVAAARIADAVESRILSALLGPGHTPEQWAEAQAKYRAGKLDDQVVSIDVPAQRAGGDGPGGIIVQGNQMSLSLSVQGMFGGPGGGGGGRERRSLTVAEARQLLEDAEAEAVLPAELLAKEAVRVAEQEGIVFIDEIDKIVNPSGAIRHGSDPSAEGVQRDLLPLIEGSVVTTKHGPVATDHVLFIASGAFTSAKPSDMMAELQGRLPIRVELKGLTAADFERILTEPDNNMIYQQQRLMGCERVRLEFTPEAVREIAALAEQVNKEVENIGARRLHTVLERLVEEVSFEAPDKVAEAQEAGGGGGGGEAAEAYVYTHVIEKEEVREKLQSLLQEQDLGKYIL